MPPRKRAAKRTLTFAKHPNAGRHQPTKKTNAHVGTSGSRTADYVPGDWYYFPNSSRVSAARYDPDNLILEVSWVDGGLNYLYQDVPSTVWRNMRRVSSVGKFVNRVLNDYPYAPRITYG